MNRLRRLVRPAVALRDRTPLRVQLVAIMLVLVTLALTLAGSAGVLALRRNLMNRVDMQLQLTVNGAPHHPPGDNPPGDNPPGDNLPGSGRPARSTAYYSCQFSPTGAATTAAHFDRREGGDADDQGPPLLPRLDLKTVVDKGSKPFTVPANGAGHAWRVRVAPLPDGSGSQVFAISLDDVEGPVDQLALVEALIGAVVLLLLGLLAYVVVRSSLRGLVAVEHTAEAIAAGDLTQRVPPAHPRTEVGRLAGALNVMLGQVETAFGERRASEEAALASEEAARASEARMRRFVADASHELRTPLTSIRGFAELYRDGGGNDPSANRVIGRIEHHAVRMGTLVDDLLLLARLDQQRPVERRPVDLLALVTDAVVDGRVTAPDHPLRLRTTSGEDDPPPVVLGDEPRLRQVIANLLTNAFTHTPAGTQVTVSVGTGGDWAILEVADAGPGMRADDAARVFERFYRTDPSRTRAHGGAGLGLSIVAALVAAHGGEVSVTTAPGAGARFEVRLPLHAAA